MAIRRIMCCCVSGLGSSVMIRMSVQKVLKQMGKSGIEVVHATVSDAQPGAADVFVIGGDLADLTGDLPNKIVLQDIMSQTELREKLEAVFDSDQQDLQAKHVSGD